MSFAPYEEHSVHSKALMQVEESVLLRWIFDVKDIDIGQMLHILSKNTTPHYTQLIKGIMGCNT